ncbi:MAG: DNA repair protein RadA [Candidatus Eisenbacteria bacterium]|nr:DNA repair protein RadA [Candidatus Eisenbacteria bacterium]
MGGKSKSVFFCTDCGHESPKWQGRCPGCGAWNTLVEQEVVTGKQSIRTSRRSAPESPIPLSKIGADSAERIPTGIAEFDRTLGGGIVPGGVVLVGGDPGIGKSTLLLEASEEVAKRGDVVLYVSGEESRSQIRMRAVRLGANSERIQVLTETDVSRVLEVAESLSPGVLVLDSIQTVYHANANGSPGSVSQVRESAASLVRYAKESGVPVFLIGHVTKQGAIAGPRILEHMVDTVLYFEGDKRMPYRILRAVKNRYGSTDEIGVFEMTARGLEAVSDPSGLFVSDEHGDTSGSVVIGVVEGTRALMVEIQALTGLTNYAVPQRSSSGVDRRRLPLVLAVLERRGGLSLGNRDVFVNVAGGVKVEEPAADLGIALSVASSYWDVPVDSRTAVFGEIGLGGEVRRVTFAAKRAQEAARLGYARIVLPRHALSPDERPRGVEYLEVRSVGEAIDALLGTASSRRSKASAPQATEV